MSTTDPTPAACGILYVDDEAQALKYFRKAFAPKFNIFTATSAEEGLEVLRREAAGVGIVVSDQRMPGMLGAEFLGRVREQHPYVVRILATAYSDLESAIQAVNTGHIYQYVVKPWEIADLGMVLQRAADYYRVLSERNELLALKMTTLQRVICSDRVKWLLLAGRGLDVPARQALHGALAALVRALPETLRPAPGGPGAFSREQFDITRLLRDEYQEASRSLDALGILKGGAAVGGAQAVADVAPLLAEFCGFPATDAAIESSGASVSLRLPACDEAKLAAALFGLLAERPCPEEAVRFFDALVAVAAGGGTLTVQTEGAAPVVFAPAENANASAIIDGLYEKFAASDISRL